MIMSLFDDDFYSTRISKRSRNGEGSGSRSSSGFRQQGSLFRVAIISSLTSSLLVVLLFVLFNNGGEVRSEAKPALTGGQALVETSERIISASEKVRPAVVSIINLTAEAMEEQASTKSYDKDEIPYNASMGSGVIFQKKAGKAYIITNAHVVQDAVKVQAVLVNGNKKDARIVGVDRITDLAVLEVSDEGIDTVVEIGNSNKLRVGEMVIAIGNPLGFGDSLTQGIVSSTRRIIQVSLNQDGIYDWEQEVIQTDAAINQGNSGGALVDLNGKLVGINSMKVSDMGVEGIGFAIPIDDAIPTLNELLERGKVLRPYMGVYSMDLGLYLGSEQAAEAEDDSEEEEATETEIIESPLPIIPAEVIEGVIVLEAVGPSLKAGLRFNDIIVELDGKGIGSTVELRKYLYNVKKIGETVKVTYYRDGKKKTAEIKLIEKEENNVDDER
jgi:serine protease Do